MGTHWSDDRVEELKRLYAQGLSGQVIGQQMGGITRNAVIGKIHRLGLAIQTDTVRVERVRSMAKARHDRNRGLTQRLSRPGRFSRPQIGTATEPPRHVEPEPIPTPDFLAIPLSELKSDSCRWPHGEGPYTFCGCQTLDGLSYCPPHYRIATTPTAEEVRA